MTQQFMIDDTTWDDVVRSVFSKVMGDSDIGDVEIWELENSSGGWFHPVHIRLVDFRIIKRVGGSGKVGRSSPEGPHLLSKRPLRPSPGP